MKRIFTIVITLFVFSNLYSQEDIPLSTHWNNGLNFQTSDKSFSAKIGGRIQYDVMFIRQDDSLNNHFEAENAAEFRRARLYTSGTIYNNIKYKFQIDFAGNRVVIKDAYLRFTKIPVVGNITLGNFKEPRGFEMLTSSNYITLMERSLTNQFDNDRNLGFMLNNSFLDKRLSLFAGYFYPSGNNAKYSGNKYDLTFRIAGLPYYNNKNHDLKLVHLGAGFTYENHDNEELSYASRPESHLAPKYLKVEMDEVSDLTEINGELVVVYNSLSFHGEYTMASISTGKYSALQQEKYAFSSVFGTLSWLVTGEHKNYSKGKNAFGRLSPKSNFGTKGGFGAVELALRYSNLNLNYKDLNGGRMDNLTLGVNWYLNPVTRIMFNYIYSDIKDQGIANIYQMRFQINF
jgi:phosphate-selective porin OprO/OprP